MAEIIIMPKLGFNMSEGKLVKWYKKEGEALSKGENLFSVETDKTNMDIEATGDGVVRKLLIEEGDTIPVTLPIAIVGDAAEDIAALLADALGQLGKEASAPPETGNSAVAAVVPSSQATVSTTHGDRLRISPRARRKAAELGIALEGIEISGSGFDGGICENDILAYQALAAEKRVKVTPVARNAAAAEGVSLDEIQGSGAGGKILKADVEKAMAASTVATAEAALKVTADGKEILEEVPYAGIRKIIGQRLSESKFTSPHLYFTQKVDMAAVLELRKQVNELQPQKTSVTDFIARAAVMALQKYPEMNSSLIGETIVKYKTVNLGIAVAAPSGLIVPNVKQAEKKSVAEIARISSGLFEKARNGKLSPDEYSGGTFTISNLGMFGIENFTAIINPPEMGILAISSTKEEPCVVTKADGSKEIAIRPMMNIQLSTDHRVVDGLLAAQFVTEIKTLLEKPLSLLV